jgi:hypothetical protein
MRTADGDLPTIAEFSEIDAYEDALRVLRLANRTDPITEMVAKKIMEVAQTGERSAIRIRERALKELGVPPRDSETRESL